MGVYTHQLYDNTLYINKIQKTMMQISEGLLWRSFANAQDDKGGAQDNREADPVMLNIPGVMLNEVKHLSAEDPSLTLRMTRRRALRMTGRYGMIV